MRGRLPIQQERDCLGLASEWLRHQEALAVRGDRVLPELG